MATILQAVNLYGPKLELNQTAQLGQVTKWMSMRTGIQKSEVQMILQEINEAILYFNSQGTPIKLPGVGIFRPTIGRRGTKRIGFRPDSELKDGMNAPGAYTGKIRKRAH